MKTTACIAIVVCLGTSATLRAQQEDFVGLSSVNVSKNINRAWDLSLGGQAMFNQNLHELWLAFTDASIGYRINRNLNTEFHTRLIRFRQLDNTYSQRSLFYHTLTWSKGIGKWGITLRNRVQQLIYGEHFNDSFKRPVWYNRNRIALRYRINYYWSPYIAIDGMVPLNHVRRHGLDQYRLAAGISFTHTDYVRFDLYYQIQQQLQRASGNNTYYVLGLTASVKIP